MIGGEDPALTDRTGCTSQEDRLHDSHGGKGCSSQGGILYMDQSERDRVYQSGNHTE